MTSTYTDYEISNIRLLANSINSLDGYVGSHATALVEECDAYEAGTGSAFDGLMIRCCAGALITEMDAQSLGNHALALQLAEQISPAV